MSRRLTPEQIMLEHYVECSGPEGVTCRCQANGWMSPASHCRHVLNAIAERGYLVARPDGVVKKKLAAVAPYEYHNADIDESNHDDLASWAWWSGWDNGWNACRAHIFGGDDE